MRFCGAGRFDSRFVYKFTFLVQVDFKFECGERDHLLCYENGNVWLATIFNLFGPTYVYQQVLIISTSLSWTLIESRSFIQRSTSTRLWWVRHLHFHAFLLFEWLNSIVCICCVHIWWDSYFLLCSSVECVRKHRNSQTPALESHNYRWSSQRKWGKGGWKVSP